MNKSIIALAVAGALAASAAAQAETTLYGSARIGVTYTDPDKGKSDWDVANEASRIGVKGSEDLGGGLKAIYQYEFGVNIDGGTNSITAVDANGRPVTGTDGSPLNRRLSSVGLTGGFGTVVLGRVWSAPYLYVGSLTDVFNSSDSGGSGVMGWDRLNAYAAGNGASGGGDRIPDVVAYITPNFSGFSAAAAIVMNGDGDNRTGNKEDVDAYDIAGGYTLGGLTLGASYRGYNALDYTQWTVGAAYKFPFGLKLASTYSNRDQDGRVNGVKAADPSVWDVIAEYNFGANTVRAGYASYDHDTSGADDTDAWRVGYQYDLSKRTRLWVEYLDESNIGFTKADQTDRSFLSIGMRHDF